MSLRRLEPFHLLLFLILLIPTVLSYFVFNNFVITLILLTFLVLSFYLNVKGFTVQIPKFLAIAIGLGLLFYIVINFSWENLPDKLFVISNVLTYLQLISGKDFRTYLYLLLLSFLNMAIVGISFVSLSFGLIVFVYLFLVIYFLLILTVRFLGKRVDNKIYKHLLKYSILTYVFINLVGVFLFFILPRPSQPIFSLVGKKQTQTVISFSNDVSLGAFSSVALNNAVVFKAKIEKKVNPLSLYWRGNTLEVFKKGVWFSAHVRYAQTFPEGQLFEEKILLLPYGEKNVFTYGYPAVVEKAPPYSLDKTKGVLKLKRVPTQPVGIYLKATDKVKVRLTDKHILLMVPPETSEVLKRFIKENNIGRKDNLYDTLRELDGVFSKFRYSLTNPAPDLKSFLFEYKTGNCEYFASAAALLLRELGYPTRLVVGFYGGEYNPITGFYTVRQKDAHAWVEIYYRGRWIRYDATSVAQKSPQIEQPVLNLEKNKLLLFWDTVNTLWLEYVINLNAQKQKKVFKTIKEEIERGLSNPLSPKLLLAITVAGVIFLWFFRGLIILRVYELYLRRRYGVRVKAKTFADLYNQLWKRFPKVLVEERKRLLKLIAVFG